MLDREYVVTRRRAGTRTTEVRIAASNSRGSPRTSHPRCHPPRIGAPVRAGRTRPRHALQEHRARGRTTRLPGSGSGALTFTTSCSTDGMGEGCRKAPTPKSAQSHREPRRMRCPAKDIGSAARFFGIRLCTTQRSNVGATEGELRAIGLESAVNFLFACRGRCFGSRSVIAAELPEYRSTNNPAAQWDSTGRRDLLRRAGRNGIETRPRHHSELQATFLRP